MIDVAENLSTGVCNFSVLKLRNQALGAVKQTLSLTGRICVGHTRYFATVDRPQQFLKIWKILPNAGDVQCSWCFSNTSPVMFFWLQLRSQAL